MRVTFLGTGTSQGVPVIACRCEVCRSSDPRDKRLRSSILLEVDDRKIVVDCGPDFRQQMITNHITSIDGILITHGHKDHLGGLDDVRAFNYILKKPTPVFAPREVQDQIRQEYSYAFTGNRYPGVPEIDLHLIDNTPFRIEDIPIVPIKAVHYPPDQFVYGFRIYDFTYLTDVLTINEEELQKVIGSRVLVVNALRKRKHYSHMNLAEALDLINLIKPDQAFLTHISHQMGTFREISSELPKFVQLAFDGLTITV